MNKTCYNRKIPVSDGRPALLARNTEPRFIAKRAGRKVRTPLSRLAAFSFQLTALGIRKLLKIPFAGSGKPGAASYDSRDSG